MVTFSVSMPPEIITKIDQEKRWLSRSEVISKGMSYLLEDPGFLRKLCGIDKLPPEYQT